MFKINLMNSAITFNIDYDAATVFVMKTYDQKSTEIWNHFSKTELLDLWWAPKPWKCETQKMNFAEGGTWNYAMIDAKNQKHFAGIDYEEINSPRSISFSDYFTDENQNKKAEFPSTNWLIGFTGVKEGTKLTINLHFASTEDLNQILAMGFEDGLKTTLNQLEELLTKKD